MIRIPSVRTIRSELEFITGALKYEPTSEDAAEGTSPATEIFRIDSSEDIGSFDNSVGPASDNDERRQLDAPSVIFEVPPSLTDADIKSILGDEIGRLKRLQQIRGTDALGWYVTFHQRTAQHGIFLTAEGLLQFAGRALAALPLPPARMIEIAFHAILRHELFHFATDCMVANWELSLGIPVFWPAKKRLGKPYIELEEALANAYMLRGFRYPSRSLGDSRGALKAITSFCADQPPGYCDGPSYANSRGDYIGGCQDLSALFQMAATRDDAWKVPQPALDTVIFYPDVVRIDWRRCTILFHDRLGLFKTLGIKLSFFEVDRGNIDVRVS
jgi:hypothetical protein